MKIRGFKVADYNPRPAPCPWNIRLCVEHRGAHQGRFHSPRRFSEARVRKKGPGAHGTALGRTASQLFSGKLGANRSTNAKSHTPTTSPTPKTTRQSSQQPRQHHTNHITSNKSHTPTTSPTPKTTRPLHQRFLYCDGETPNISLKYFAKYFCVPKPTASETSTTLSPASADNSWAALLSRMVRMNTEGFIP